MHDTKLLAATIEAIVVERPDPCEYPQHLCLDKAYDNPTGKAATEAAGYIPTSAGSAKRSSTRTATSATPPAAG